LLLIGITAGNGAEYKGYYDLSARETGYLCSLMDEYKKTGKQPDLVSKPAPEDFPKNKYIREDNKCWKMKWSPCSKHSFKSL
jgi:hypothetical protein